MDFIEQEDEHGCSIACIAMLTGRTYQSVRDDFENDFSKEGMVFDLTLDYLGNCGYSIVYKTTRNFYEVNFARKEMLRPFAPVHIVRIMPKFDSKHGHLVVMDAKGKLICPQKVSDKEIRKSYEISDVAGLYK